MPRSNTAAAAAVAPAPVPAAAARRPPPQLPRQQNKVGKPGSGAAAGRRKSSAAAAGTIDVDFPAAEYFPTRRETRDPNTAVETSLDAEEAAMRRKMMNFGDARGFELS